MDLIGCNIPHQLLKNCDFYRNLEYVRKTWVKFEKKDVILW